VSTAPGGIVTFLFTDVEGSTRLAKEMGDARWAELLEQHQGILRQSFSAHFGREVDTQGDSFFVVFARPTDAVAAAIEGQRSLEEHPWPDGGRVRVRLGLHTGDALARGDRYVGQEVHRASRICDAGHGGQIVVSETTADLVKGSLSKDTTLAALGQHRLKDLSEPQRLFQLGTAGLPLEFPRLRSLDAPHNLPAERSSFVGREQEIATVRKLLDEHSLVTLTGIGGSGKTRLALRVGAQELPSYPDGVFFVDLASVRDPDLVAQTMATSCDPSLSSLLQLNRAHAVHTSRRGRPVWGHCWPAGNRRRKSLAPGKGPRPSDTA
jgi:class 3 adenylate cyclase